MQGESAWYAFRMEEGRKRVLLIAATIWRLESWPNLISRVLDDALYPAKESRPDPHKY